MTYYEAITQTHYKRFHELHRDTKRFSELHVIQSAENILIADNTMITRPSTAVYTF